MEKNIQFKKPSIKRESPEFMKPLQPQNKTYSFTDPLYQSFGDYNHQNIKNGHKVQKNYEIEAFESYEIHSSQLDAEMMFELEEISDRISLMSKMLKINKQITNPSVLMVNSQNKMKTEMLIETKRMNNDENSIILCENASKYLTFLEVLNEEEEIYASNMKNYVYFENPTEIIEQSRETRENKLEESNKMYFGQIMEETAKKFELTKEQILREKTLNSKDNKDWYLTHDNSRNFSSNPKTTNFSSGFSTAEKMFQGIKTPQNQVFEGESSFIFTPLKQQSQYQDQFKIHENESKITKNFKSPQSSAILQVKKEVNKPSEKEIHTFNKKFQETKTKSPIKILKAQMSNISKERSKSKNEKSKQNLLIEKKEKSQDSKIKKKDRSFTNLESMVDSKNLAYKTLNKTNQFDRMLKMASSRINES